MRRLSSSFVKVANQAISLSEIAQVDGTDIEQLCVRLYLNNGNMVEARDIEALDIVMQVKPSLVEGKRLKFAKHAWVIHNFVGHPLMQILAFFKMYSWAFYVHEATVPRPLGKK